MPNMILKLATFGAAALVTLRYLSRRPRPSLQITREAVERSNRYCGNTPAQDTAVRFMSILPAHGPSDLSKVTPETLLIVDLGLNDLEPVEIVLAIEDEFKMKASENDAVI